MQEKLAKLVGYLKEKGFILEASELSRFSAEGDFSERFYRAAAEVQNEFPGFSHLASKYPIENYIAEYIGRGGIYIKISAIVKGNSAFIRAELKVGEKVRSSDSSLLLDTEQSDVSAIKASMAEAIRHVLQDI